MCATASRDLHVVRHVTWLLIHQYFRGICSETIAQKVLCGPSFSCSGLAKLEVDDSCEMIVICVIFFYVFGKKWHPVR